MTARRTSHVDEQPVYRYRYIGTSPAVFSDLTAAGVGSVEPGAVLQVPVLLVHADLEPADKATKVAVAELVEWADALEANAGEDQVDVLDEPAVEEPDPAGAAVQTEEH